MFMTMLTTGWTVMHLFVFWRLTTIPAVVRFVPRRFLWTAGFILWTIIFLPRLLDSRGFETTAGYFEVLEMNWLGSIFLIFFCLLVTDVVTVCGLFWRRHVPIIRLVGLLAGVFLALFALFQGLRSPVVRDYEVSLPGLPAENDGLVVAVISDLHVGRLLDGDWLAARINQVQQLKPDMVVMLGDLFEGHNASERQDNMKAALRSLTARYGLWAVTGNHESHGGEDSGAAFLEEAGVHGLHNEWVEVLPGLVLGGVDDGGHREPTVTSANRVEQMLAEKPPVGASVFLSHRPQMVEEAASAGVGLMLSGHTHGGQIWPFSYIVGWVNPWLAGRYEIGAMSLIVTRGTGTWGPRMRLWAPSEILRITLHTH